MKFPPCPNLLEPPKLDGIVVTADALKAWLDQLAVDGLFGKIKPVAEFDLGSGFAANRNMDVRII